MKVAVLGCGSIGRRHLRLLVESGCDCIAYDIAPEARQSLQDIHGVQIADSLDVVWQSSPDIAFVTTTTREHISLATQAAAQDCNVFIEKPLSHSLDGVDTLATILSERGLQGMVGCNMRFHHGPSTVRRLLSNGAIGDILAARIHCASYLPTWRPHQDFTQSYSADPESGGAILDIIHEIDLALWYLGPARLAHATVLPATALGLQTDGLAELILHHESGAISEVHINFVQRDASRGCTIIGTEGTIHWTLEQGDVRVVGPDGTTVETFPPPDDWDLDSMYRQEIQHFLDAIHNGTPVSNPIAEATDTLRIALEARNT